MLATFLFCGQFWTVIRNHYWKCTSYGCICKRCPQQLGIIVNSLELRYFSIDYSFSSLSDLACWTARGRCDHVTSQMVITYCLYDVMMDMMPVLQKLTPASGSTRVSTYHRDRSDSAHALLVMRGMATYAVVSEYIWSYLSFNRESQVLACTNCSWGI